MATESVQEAIMPPMVEYNDLFVLEAQSNYIDAMNEMSETYTGDVWEAKRQDLKEEILGFLQRNN